MPSKLLELLQSCAEDAKVPATKADWEAKWARETNRLMGAVGGPGAAAANIALIDDIYQALDVIKDHLDGDSSIIAVGRFGGVAINHTMAQERAAIVVALEAAKAAGATNRAEIEIAVRRSVALFQQPYVATYQPSAMSFKRTNDTAVTEIMLRQAKTASAPGNTKPATKQGAHRDAPAAALLNVATSSMQKPTSHLSGRGSPALNSRSALDRGKTRGAFVIDPVPLADGSYVINDGAGNAVGKIISTEKDGKWQSAMVQIHGHITDPVQIMQIRIIAAEQICKMAKAAGEFCIDVRGQSPAEVLELAFATMSGQRVPMIKAPHDALFKGITVMPDGTLNGITDAALATRLRVVNGSDDFLDFKYKLIAVVQYKQITCGATDANPNGNPKSVDAQKIVDGVKGAVVPYYGPIIDVHRVAPGGALKADAPQDIKDLLEYVNGMKALRAADQEPVVPRTGSAASGKTDPLGRPRRG